MRTRGAGARKAVVGAGLLALPLLFLAGCMNIVSPQSYDLIVTAVPGNRTVTAKVTGPSADLYRWDWGDGTKEETSIGVATHTYPTLDVYTVTVEVLQLGTAGDGGPGSGGTVDLQVVSRFSEIVDLRPAVELVGFDVIVLNPPPWYNPEAWEADCYPAACNLKINARLKYNRPAEARMARAVWTVFDAFGNFILQYEGDPLYFPGEKFLARSCHGRGAYRIHLAVFLTTGDVLEYTKTIYACPPSGAGCGPSG